MDSPPSGARETKAARHRCTWNEREREREREREKEKRKRLATQAFSFEVVAKVEQQWRKKFPFFPSSLSIPLSLSLASFLFRSLSPSLSLSLSFGARGSAGAGASSGAASTATAACACQNEGGRYVERDKDNERCSGDDFLLVETNKKPNLFLDQKKHNFTTKPPSPSSPSRSASRRCSFPLLSACRTSRASSFQHKTMAARRRSRRRRRQRTSPPTTATTLKEEAKSLPNGESSMKRRSEPWRRAPLPRAASPGTAMARFWQVRGRNKTQLEFETRREREGKKGRFFAHPTSLDPQTKKTLHQKPAATTGPSSSGTPTPAAPPGLCAPTRRPSRPSPGPAAAGSWPAGPGTAPSPSAASGASFGLRGLRLAPPPLGSRLPSLAGPRTLGASRRRSPS